MNFLRKIGLIQILYRGIYCDTSASYDYNLNGADWGKHFPDCGNGGNQSPIDLRTYIHSNPFPNVSMHDEIQKTYSNIKNKQVIWTGNTIKVPVEDSSAIYKT